MSDLSAFRDYALTRADFQPSDEGRHKGLLCKTSTWRKAEHAKCLSTFCRCVCHKPTDDERALWTRLADEVDAYLSGDEGEGLF